MSYKSVYLSGPMRGVEHFNFPAFDEARDRFKANMWLVISPADMDRDFGFDGMRDALPTNAEKRDGLLRRMLFRDLDAILFGYANTPPPTHIALLPGWEHSDGVSVELSLARFLGLGARDAVTMDVMACESGREKP